MSKARQKGTKGEHYFLDHLKKVWPWADRAPLKGANDHGDYLNVPWLHEAKFVNQPRFIFWTRVARVKAGDRWTLLWKGDMRGPDGIPVVFTSLPMYLELIEAWQQVHGYLPSHPSSDLVAHIDEYVQRVPA